MSVGSSVLSFAGVAAVLTVTPGLDTALVLRSAVAGGRRQATATAVGISAGLFVWAVAASVGVSALLAASRLAYDGLRLAGAVYMVVLGVAYLRHARRGVAAEVSEGGATVSVAASLRAGLLTNLLNPKVGAFYVALLPQFIPPGHSAIGMGVLLALVHIAETSLWFAVLIAVARSARAVLARPTPRRMMDALTGTVLVGFGLRLAVTAR